MALATQCPHCLTVFRVASDQLKLRGGLVRCGSCRQVFNGNEFLVEPSVADGHYQPMPGSHAQAVEAPPVLMTPPQARVPAPPVFSPSSTFSASPPEPMAAPTAAATPATPAAPVAPAVVAAAQAAPIPPARPAIPVVAEPKVFRSPSSPGYIPDLGAPLKSAPGSDSSAEAAISTPSTNQDSDGVPLLRRASEDAPAADLDETFRIDPLPVRADALAHSTDAIDDAVHDDDEAARLRSGTDGAQADAEATGETDQIAQADDSDEPAFVRRAERKARISHALKTVMMILCGVMVPLLLLQSLYYWRNPLAEALPQVRPMLNGMCVALHCTVGLPAEIERLSLEANELQVVPPNQNVYALTVVMRNRGSSAQAWPHLELTLNNDDEKAVVRRVFRPRDYLAEAGMIDNGIAGDSEQQIKLNFELKDALVSGYRIYLFYP